MKPSWDVSFCRQIVFEFFFKGFLLVTLEVLKSVMKNLMC